MKPAIVHIDLYRASNNDFKLVVLAGGVPMDFTGYNALLVIQKTIDFNEFIPIFRDSIANPEMFTLTDQGEVVVHFLAEHAETILAQGVCEMNYILNLLEPGQVVEDLGYRLTYGRVKVVS